MENPNLSHPLLTSRLSKWIDEQVRLKKLPMGEVLVQKKGKVICHYLNKGEHQSMPDNLVYRICSMTKSVTSVALMMLVEEGKCSLEEPLWKYLGEKWRKKNMTVMNVPETRKTGKIVTMPCKRSITLYHLMTHTSGLGSGLTPLELGCPIDVYYHSKNLSAEHLTFDHVVGTLQELCDKLAECPLFFQPGSHYHYSYSLDILGRVIEVISGQSLEDFFQERIFKKLGMFDTSLRTMKGKEHRVYPVYIPAGGPHKGGAVVSTVGMGKVGSGVPPYDSGSGGLYSTPFDYLLFAEMLLRGGVSRSGERIISTKHLQWMTMNHLKVNGKPATMLEAGFENWASKSRKGLGFGMGFGVVVDNNHDQFYNEIGEYHWGGAASTLYWVDPKNEVIVVFCTQLMLPDGRDIPINPALHALVYGAIDDDNHIPSSKL